MTTRKTRPASSNCSSSSPTMGIIDCFAASVTILHKLLAYIKAENLFRLSAFFSPIMKFRQKGWRSSGRLSFFDFDPSWFLKGDWIGYWSNGKGIHLFIPYFSSSYSRDSNPSKKNNSSYWTVWLKISWILWLSAWASIWWFASSIWIPSKSLAWAYFEASRK